MNKAVASATTLAAVLLAAPSPRAQNPANPVNPANPLNPASPVNPANPAGLKSTNHPRLPPEASQYWMAPTSAQLRAPKSVATVAFLEGIRFEIDSNFAKALPLVSQPSVQEGTLGDYARYYQG